jgi:hypothetical protein
MHTVFWLESLKGRDHAEDTGVDGRILFIMDLKEGVWERVD